MPQRRIGPITIMADECKIGEDPFWEHFTIFIEGTPFRLHTDSDINGSRPKPIIDLPPLGCGLNAADKWSDEGLDEIASMSRKWLSDCRNHHDVCKRAIQNMSSHVSRSKSIPTRLIDVVACKLVITEGNEAYSEYATLSYAWGDRPLGIKTYASNIHDQTRGIKWSALSKTIQDAFIVSKKINVRYLWVDSLCVLQSEGPNDMTHAADWHREAARFGGYYEDSAITIAATGARDASEGLFLHGIGKACYTLPYTIQRVNKLGLLSEATIYPDQTLWAREVYNSPLADRGWAAQERLLSKRILHFGKNCICWECHELWATEMNPTRLDSYFYEYQEAEAEYDGPSGLDLQVSFRDLSAIPAELIPEMWFDYVETYSGTQFTFLSDRLPALSGLAERVQPYIRQTYSSGLWKESIAQGLSWHTCAFREFPEPDVSTVPTWSWASSAGHVKFSFYGPGRHWESMAHIDEKASNAGGLEMPNDIVPERLTLRGRTMLTSLDALELEEETNAAGMRFFIFKRLSPNERIEWFWPIPHVLYLDSRQVDDFLWGSFECFLLGKVVRDCLPYEEPDDHSETPGVALVLAPTGRKRGCAKEYRRVGILAVPFERYWAQVEEDVSIDLI